MTEIENPQNTPEELEFLEKKIKDNKAEVSDYEKIDTFLSSVGLDRNYIKYKMIQNGINNYEEYLDERKKNKISTAEITGTILGVISALKKYLTNKMY